MYYLYKKGNKSAYRGIKYVTVPLIINNNLHRGFSRKQLSTGGCSTSKDLYPCTKLMKWTQLDEMRDSKFMLNQTLGYKLTSGYVSWVTVRNYQMVSWNISWRQDISVDIRIYQLTSGYISWCQNYQMASENISLHQDISVDVRIYQLTSGYISWGKQLSDGVLKYQFTSGYISWRQDISVEVNNYQKVSRKLSVDVRI